MVIIIADLLKIHAKTYNTHTHEITTAGALYFWIEYMQQYNREAFPPPG